MPQNKENEIKETKTISLDLNQEEGETLDEIRGITGLSTEQIVRVFIKDELLEFETDQKNFFDRHGDQIKTIRDGIKPEPADAEIK